MIPIIFLDFANCVHNFRSSLIVCILHIISSIPCRYMMLIDGRNEVYMIDRDNSVFHIANLEFPYRKDMRTHLSNTLLDGVSVQQWDIHPLQDFRVYFMIIMAKNA